jgi:sec-independent protein translocase protein TatC
VAQTLTGDSTAETPPAPGQGEPQEEGMTMLEHLEELRNRMVTSAIAFILGLIAAVVPLPPDWQKNLTAHLINAVIGIVGRDNLIAIKPGETFFTYFQTAMLVGLSLALPVILYQAMAFVLPALHPHEKKYFYMAVPGATLAFILGVLFGYYVVLPAAIHFLIIFGQAIVEQKWAFAEYADTATTLLFWMGLAFEMPLSIFFLCKLRVLNVERLKGYRKYALLGSFIVGALITPTPDPFNQTLVSLPLYFLFEIGLLLARLA